jgi:hypothetical protein
MHISERADNDKKDPDPAPPGGFDVGGAYEEGGIRERGKPMA